ncbi:MAG: YidB family protein [Gemmatimonadaceae bacterium]
MGLLDGLVGGFVGGEMASVVSGLIAKHGGLSGIVQQFQQQGMGATIGSWVGTGPNMPISPDQVHQALGSDTIAQLAAKIGISPQDLSTKLAAVLPGVVDKMTPAGVVPPGQ